MNDKIILVTPPDIFENYNLSVLLVHPDNKDQDEVSKWIYNSKYSGNINFYVYDGQNNLDWFFHAINLCKYKYINLDNTNFITQHLASYILGKDNFFYKTSDNNISSLYSYISNNRIYNIESLLERIVSE